MNSSEGSNSNVAIVAILVIGVLIAGGLALYFSGTIGGRDTVHETTIIEVREAPPKEEEEEKENGN